jgi:hypothetical protein
VQNGQVKNASDFHRPMLASLQASRRQDEKYYRLQGKADASEPDKYTALPLTKLLTRFHTNHGRLWKTLER